MFPKLFPPPDDKEEHGESDGNDDERDSDGHDDEREREVLTKKKKNVFAKKKRNHVPTLVLHGHKGLKLQRCNTQNNNLLSKHEKKQQQQQSQQHQNQSRESNPHYSEPESSATAMDVQKKNDNSSSENPGKFCNNNQCNRNNVDEGQSVKTEEGKGMSLVDAIVIDSSDSETDDCDNNQGIKDGAFLEPTPSSSSFSLRNNRASTPVMAASNSLQSDPSTTTVFQCTLTPTEPSSLDSSCAIDANHPPPLNQGHRATMQPIFYDTDSNDSSDSFNDGNYPEENGFDGPLLKKYRLDDIIPPSQQSYSGGSSSAAKEKDTVKKKSNATCDHQVLRPTSAFGGEVFFTQVLPRWCPPRKGSAEKSNSAQRRQSNETIKEGKRRNHDGQDVIILDSDDDDDDDKDKKINISKSAPSTTASEGNGEATSNNDNESPPEMKNVSGVHHPKYFLLFERCGSMVVIISTCNLSSQTAVDSSWVQRFEPKELLSPGRSGALNGSHGSISSNNGPIDMGLPADFGVVLTDLLKKQSEAAEQGGFMLPDLFLRRFVDGLSLNSLVDRFRFEDAQVHLVSTVPGDYLGCLPTNGNGDSRYNPSLAKKRNMTYGPQRVSFVLSRILNESHIRSARAAMSSVTGGLMGSKMDSVVPWLPPALVTKMERLVVQPTSFGGTWTRQDMEIMTHSYLRPHWKVEKESQDESMVVDEGLLGLLDIVWPAFDYFDEMREKRIELQKNHPNRSVAVKPAKKTSRGDCHVFLSSVSFSKLDRSCISRMSLFESSHPPQMPCTTASLHSKSICRLLSLNNTKLQNNESISRLPTTSSQQQSTHHDNVSNEYLSWFMLTSACLSRGAQGQPTPYRGIESDSMSYSNFELGVLFCSRLLGDQQYDRLYTYNPLLEGCQCGSGKRWYKDRLRGEALKKEQEQHQPPSFLGSVRKIHLPIPYQLRPKSYQDDPDSDLMSYTPYLHEIPDGTGHVGNMKLTPLGQRLANETCM